MLFYSSTFNLIPTCLKCFRLFVAQSKHFLVFAWGCSFSKAPSFLLVDCNYRVFLILVVFGGTKTDTFELIVGRVMF